MKIGLNCHTRRKLDILHLHDQHFVFITVCWRHTVPILTQDGQTNKNKNKFGSDRNNIAPFVRAFCAIV